MFYGTHAVAVAAVLLLAGCAGPGVGPLDALQRPLAAPTLVDLNVDPAGPLKGDADAPIQIIAYEAPACSVCKHNHQSGYPAIFADYVDPGHATWYAQAWSIGQSYDERAGIALECVYQQGGSAAYFAFQDRVYSPDYPDYAGMTHQDVRDELKALASVHDLDQDRLVACYEAKETEDELRADIRAGSAWGARSSPAFIVLGPDLYEAVMARDLEPTLRAAVAAMQA